VTLGQVATIVASRSAKSEMTRRPDPRAGEEG
jgi:hypothetical protein